MALLLLLLFLGLTFFFVIKFSVIITAVAAIILGSITVTVLAIVWLATSRSLNRTGKYRYTGQMTYQQIQSDLSQISEDLNGIRWQLQDIAPQLHDMEFLKYARREDTDQGNPQ
ncbi:MAG: hypothetical protein OXP71_08840 [Candidatus Poribacteria bacterium]|nr:hypothetical protein [Candidatus Poribacteria bacterium]